MTFHPTPAALDSWSVAELVAFHMAATENLRFTEDESEVEANA